MTAKSKNKPRRSGTRQSRKKDVVWLSSQAEMPASYSPLPKAVRKFRYVYELANAVDINRSVTVSDIRFALVALSSTGTVCISLIRAFRLLRVDHWLIPKQTTGISSGTAGIEWSGTNDPNMVREVHLSGYKNAHVSTRPPPHASSSWWNSADEDNDELFLLILRNAANCTSVVDIELEYVLESATASTGTITSTSQGIYFTALDNDLGTPRWLADVPSGNRIDTQIS